MQAYAGAADFDAFAVTHGLRRAHEIRAETQPHDIERFLRGEHGAMTRACMVAMAMGNHGLVNRTRRIDMEATERAVHPALRRQNNVLQPH